MMKIKSIIIIEPSTSGLELLKRSKNMNLNTIVFTANQDERIIPNDYKQYIQTMVVVDTNNLDEVFAAGKDIVSKYDVLAVIPGFEFYVGIASMLSNYLKVVGLDINTANALQYKNVMRRLLHEKGIQVPQHMVVTSLNDLYSFKHKLKFPCVVKPVDSAGSLHVSKADNFNEVVNAYIDMCNDSWTEMDKGVGSVAIVEEYISGEEFSADGFVNHDQICIVSITEKILGSEPYFVEMGHIVQPDLQQELKDQITTYTASIVNALNIKYGAFHCEIRMSEYGPILMEIAGRLPGDRICDLICLATNFDIYEATIKSYIGEPISYNLTLNQYAGIRFFHANNRSYTKIHGIDILAQMPGYNLFKVIIEPNTEIPALTSFRGRVAYCIFTANSYDELKRRLDSAEEVITFE